LPLILFALFTSAQYLQVGAVAVVSLLTANAVSTITAAESSAVAVLKSAASSASKAYAAQRTNPALAVLNVRATAAYNAANVELIQTQIDTASLLAFYVGIFSFGIGFLKLGNVMNLMGPAVSTRPFGLPCCARPRRMRLRRAPQSPASSPPPA
jgi:MFS superfamily sulfate permease-like transporter